MKNRFYSIINKEKKTLAFRDKETNNHFFNAIDLMVENLNNEYDNQNEICYKLGKQALNRIRLKKKNTVYSVIHDISQKNKNSHSFGENFESLQNAPNFVQYTNEHDPFSTNNLIPNNYFYFKNMSQYNIQPAFQPMLSYPFKNIPHYTEPKVQYIIPQYTQPQNNPYELQNILDLNLKNTLFSESNINIGHRDHLMTSYYKC